MSCSWSAAAGSFARPSRSEAARLRRTVMQDRGTGARARANASEPAEIMTLRRGRGPWPCIRPPADSPKAHEPGDSWSPGSPFRSRSADVDDPAAAIGEDPALDLGDRV